MSIVDTHEAQFAEYVLSRMEGNAAAIRDWTDWDDDGIFQAKVLNQVDPVNTQLRDKDIGGGAPFPDGSMRHIRYELEFGRKNDRVRTATLYVKSGRYGEFRKNKKIYTTAFVFLGM